jgi:hypothetical protein
MRLTSQPSRSAVPRASGLASSLRAADRLVFFSPFSKTKNRKTGKISADLKSIMRPIKSLQLPKPEIPVFPGRNLASKKLRSVNGFP